MPPRAIARAINTVGSTLDRGILGLMKSTQAMPKRRDLKQLRGRTEQTWTLYARRGFFERPHSFHADPVPDFEPRVRAASMYGVPYDILDYPSEYSGDEDDPAWLEWRKLKKNRLAYAYVMKHTDPYRPWVVCIHGLGTGSAYMDFPAFHVPRLYYTMGFNVALPVLPLHGPRRDRGIPRGALLTYDLMRSVHGIRQSVWDVRRLIRWIRAHGAPKIGVMGISMGAYTASLIAGLEDVDVAIAGIPLVDVPELIDFHCPPELKRRVDRFDVLGERTRQIYELVSAETLTPIIPRERCFMFAGRSDRITPPAQATKLWRAWHQPTMKWFDGGHISFFYNRGVDDFVEDALKTLLI